MRLNHKLSTLVAIAAVASIGLPGIASAHSDKSRGDDRGQMQQEDRQDNRNDLGLRIFDGIKTNHMDTGLMGMFYRGTVSAVSATGFTLSDGTNTMTVTTANAKLIRLPQTTITLADIKATDKVWIN